MIMYINMEIAISFCEPRDNEELYSAETLLTSLLNCAEFDLDMDESLKSVVIFSIKISVLLS